MILCALSDWRDKSSKKGKVNANAVQVRLVIATNSMNWIIGKQSGSNAANVTGSKFFGNMASIMGYLWHTQASEFKHCLREIVTALIARTGITEIKYSTPTNKAEAVAVGKLFDDVFDTSFMRDFPPTVQKRLFADEVQDQKDEEAEEEEEEEEEEAE